jgi:hypothetical protein
VRGFLTLKTCELFIFFSDRWQKLCLPASIFASLVSLRSALSLCPIIDDLEFEGLSCLATVAHEPEHLAFYP